VTARWYEGHPEDWNPSCGPFSARNKYVTLTSGLLREVVIEVAKARRAWFARLERGGGRVWWDRALGWNSGHGGGGRPSSAVAVAVLTCPRLEQLQQTPQTRYRPIRVTGG